MRINKFLSDAGFCSRRAADELIKQGKVTVNGRVAEPGRQVSDADEVRVDGTLISASEKKDILIAFNKPVGIVCTATDKQGKNNVVDYLGIKERIYPIGRLDKESEGLLLLTNNGDITYKMLKANGRHEKEYIVDTDRYITQDFIVRMSGGIYLKELDKTTAPCKVTPLYKKGEKKTKSFSIVLVQGMNRQIRRMCEACGYKVRRLKRIRIMNITLNDLQVGKYRYVTGDEYDRLIKGLNPEDR